MRGVHRAADAELAPLDSAKRRRDPETHLDQAIKLRVKGNVAGFAVGLGVEVAQVEILGLADPAVGTEHVPGHRQQAGRGGMEEERQGLTAVEAPAVG